MAIADFLMHTPLLKLTNPTAWVIVMPRICTFDDIEVAVLTRDEHCPPHVHAFSVQKKWQVRIFFSYVNAEASSLTFDVLAGKPRVSDVTAVMDAVMDHLDACRAEFWNAVRSVCLDNQYVSLDRRGIFNVSRPLASEALRVRAARYVHAARSLEIQAHGLTEMIMGACPQEV